MNKFQINQICILRLPHLIGYCKILHFEYYQTVKSTTYEYTIQLLFYYDKNNWYDQDFGEVLSCNELYLI